MQKPVKTKSHLVINGARPYAQKVNRAKPCGIMGFLGGHCWMWLPTWGNLYWDSFGRGVREATESMRWKNFRRQGAMKRRRDRQASLSWLMADCLPSGLNHDLWLTGGGRGEGGKEGGSEWELHKTSSSLGDCSGHSLMIKNRGSVFSLHACSVFFFVVVFFLFSFFTLRLVCNLLYMLAWNAQSTTAWEVAPGWKQKKENAFGGHVVNTQLQILCAQTAFNLCWIHFTVRKDLQQFWRHSRIYVLLLIKEY